MGEAPAIGTLDTNFGAGNVLFSDAAEASGSGIPVEWGRLSTVHIVAPTNTYVDASLGWTDARLAFVEYPELAQPFGGALTTNPTEALHVTPAEYALVFTRGRLVDDSGRIVATESPRYHWVFLPREVRSVRCVGFCVVAAQTTSLPDAPLDPAPHESEPVAFQAPMPWLVTAVLPAGEKPLLRYDVTYDSMWDAYYAGALLPHVRIDGIVNGWLVPRRARSTRVFIIEIGAALIALSELVSAAWIFLVIYYALRTNAAMRADRIEATAKSDSPI